MTSLDCECLVFARVVVIDRRLVSWMMSRGSRAETTSPPTTMSFVLVCVQWEYKSIVSFLKRVRSCSAHSLPSSDRRPQVVKLGENGSCTMLEAHAHTYAIFLLFALSRSPVIIQRSAWYPYFMDVNAIIFLAPISVFDEPLAEDRKVNRLEDSFLLWKAVCSSKLLAKVRRPPFLLSLSDRRRDARPHHPSHRSS